jgi:UPF0755 protein
MARKNSAKQKSKVKRKANRTGILLLSILAFVAALFFYMVFLRPATQFKGEEATITIPRDKTNKDYVKNEIKKYVDPVNYTTFMALAEWSGYWKNIMPGRYVVQKNSSIFGLFRRLHGGIQTPVTLVINKFRTKKDLANYLGNKLESSSKDYLKFISNADSLASMGLNSESMMTIIIPNSYDIYWNTNPREFMERMQKESNRFWTSSRIGKAKSLGMSKEEVITIASIVEEETNNNEEKPLIASVYINRLNKGMALGADPTIKFALGNFGLRRILLGHINSTASSPYNTYKNKGLPPGPICTPSISSIDAVLVGEKTTYLFFCAKADFSGSHSFASTDEEHFENARKYRRALDSMRIH